MGPDPCTDDTIANLYLCSIATSLSVGVWSCFGPGVVQSDGKGCLALHGIANSLGGNAASLNVPADSTNLIKRRILLCMD